MHEGCGGCEADSNRDLITETVTFDWREGDDQPITLILALIELGWLEQEWLDEQLEDEASSLKIKSFPEMSIQFMEGRDRADDAIEVHALGTTKETMHLFAEQATLRLSYNQFLVLRTLLSQIHKSNDQAAFLRFYLKRAGSPMRPYNVKAKSCQPTP